MQRRRTELANQCIMLVCKFCSPSLHCLIWFSRCSSAWWVPWARTKPVADAHLCNSCDAVIIDMLVDQHCFILLNLISLRVLRLGISPKKSGYWINTKQHWSWRHYRVNPFWFRSYDDHQYLICRGDASSHRDLSARWSDEKKLASTSKSNKFRPNVVPNCGKDFFWSSFDCGDGIT